MIPALVLPALLLLQTSAAAVTQDAARADAIVQKAMHGEGAVGI